MDKYEYKVKMQQIKSLIEQKDFTTAVEIADGINWKKVKNSNTLTHIGKVYAEVGRYDDSIELLLMAYDRSPIGRNIVYELTCVAIKAGKLESARNYYNEFLEIAPQDPMKFILRYHLAKALGASLQEQIGILEEYKELDYSEEWSYELAYLYHKAGMGDQCVEECDELELWFGDGIYVEKALELKMLYQPLTRHQEDKYRQLKQSRSGIVEVRPTDELESGEIVNTPVKIPTVKTNPSKFNTVNLQAELARSMQEIMDAKEKDEVTDTLNNVKKMAAEIPYLQMDPDVEEKAQRLSEMEEEAEIDGTLKNDFQELLAEDYDGQISMKVPESNELERQITGQISIDDILAEWEKTKHAAEVAMENAKMRKLESAKQRALQETGNLMEKLQDVMPQIEASQQETQDEFTPEVSQEEDAKAYEPEVIPVPMPNLSIPNEEPAPYINTEEPEEFIPQPQADEFVPETSLEEDSEEPVNYFEPQQPVQPQVPAPDEIEFDLEDFEMGSGYTQQHIYEPEEVMPAEEEPVEELPTEEMTAPEEPVEEMLTEETPMADEPDGQEPQAEVNLEESMQEAEKEADGITDILKQELSGILSDGIGQLKKAGQGIEELLKKPENKLPDPTQKLPSLDQLIIDEAKKEQDKERKEAQLIADAIGDDEYLRRNITMPVIADLSDDDDIPQIAEPEDEFDEYDQTELTEEQRKTFSYFVPVSGMERQICQVLVGAAKRMRDADGTSASGNIIIQGYPGSGKTQMASNLLKALQQKTGRMIGRPGRIYADSLNQKDVAKVFEKVKGGCLIIEKAGDLTSGTARILSDLMEQDTDGLLVILEDTRLGIEDAMKLDASFAKKFTEKISIPIFTSDELVTFARRYARDEGYSIDEMGILALYNRIGNVQRVDQATTLTEVKDILDEAIENSEKSGFRKAFGNVFSKNKSEEGLKTLVEKDFEG
ncbi:MAG: hypothetical protein K6G01_02470 [Eubacterium sp.]|nr:hypothetical protein [Eubacterium sp.]